MFSPSQLNESQLDFLKELVNIGAGHAATALSVMLGQEITLNVPEAKFYAFNDICQVLNGPENLVVGTLVEIVRDLTGYVLLVQDFNEAKELGRSVARNMGMGNDNSPDDDLSEMERSALLEIANILSGAYLTAISSLTGLTILTSVPTLVVDMAGAVLNLPAATYGEYADIVLFMETEFQANNQKVGGSFFLTPDVSSFQVLLRSMGIE